MVNNDREVAVTGVGIVSPLGVGRDEFWRRLCAGESGIAAGQAPDGEGAAARLSGFSPRDLIHTPHLRRMDDASRMVVGAAALALADARIDADDADRQSLGVVVGSAFSDINDTLEYLRRLAAKGPALVSPMMFPNLVLNAPASYAAMEIGASGVNFTVSQGEVSAERAISLGCDLIRSGRVEVVLTGGGDQLGTIIWTAYQKMRALAAQRGGREWSSPYDVDRSGLVLGEGAAILVLESVERARRRGAMPYAFVENDIAFGVPSSLYDWPTEADAAAAVLGEFLATTGADERFRKEATLRPPLLTKEGARGRSSVDVVFGSANSSRRLDQFEVDLLSRLFGEGAASVSVTSIKGAIGEFGGAGALTAAAAVLALRDGVVPPLCNLRNPIESALRFAGTTAAARPVKRVLQLSTARGGAMSAILFRGNRE